MLSLSVQDPSQPTTEVGTNLEAGLCGSMEEDCGLLGPRAHPAANMALGLIKV